MPGWMRNFVRPGGWGSSWASWPTAAAARAPRAVGSPPAPHPGGVVTPCWETRWPRTTLRLTGRPRPSPHRGASAGARAASRLCLPGAERGRVGRRGTSLPGGRWVVLKVQRPNRRRPCTSLAKEAFLLECLAAEPDIHVPSGALGYRNDGEGWSTSACPAWWVCPSLR